MFSESGDAGIAGGLGAGWAPAFEAHAFVSWTEVTKIEPASADELQSAVNKASLVLDDETNNKLNAMLKEQRNNPPSKTLSYIENYGNELMLLTTDFPGKVQLCTLKYIV